jgi:selenocysteine lyase/cysteine desulfurase
MILDGDHTIAVRTGLHCAPLIHADLGTAPAGTIRFSLGWNTTDQDIERAIAAVEAMSAAA